MTHLILPQMVKRRKGAVVTIASGASAKPTPQMTVYSATKVWSVTYDLTGHYLYHSNHRFLYVL